MSKQLKELKKLSKDELKAKATELTSQLFKLRMQKVTGQLVNTAMIKTTRKQLARMKTLETQLERKA